jgi:hypothetical protein
MQLFWRQRKAPEERNVYRIKATPSIPTPLFRAESRIKRQRQEGERLKEKG